MSVYSDINASYNRSKRRLVFKVEDIDSVIQSIVTIFSVAPGEMFFLPEFGSRISELLFDPIDEITSQRILVSIVASVERWDSRVKINWPKSFVIPEADNNLYRVQISLIVNGLEDENFFFRGNLGR